MPATTKGPLPTYYLMAKQGVNNSCPGQWTELADSTRSECILALLTEMADSPTTPLYYDELTIFMGMGSILIPQGRNTDD